MSITYGTPATATSPVSQITVPLASTTAGDLNMVAVSVHSTPGHAGVQPVVATPAGWTAVGDSWKSGTPSHEVAVFWRVYQAGDGSNVVVQWGTGTNQPGGAAGAAVALTPDLFDASTPIVSGESSVTQSAGPTTCVTDSLSLGGSRLVFSAFGNRSGATWSAAGDGNVHDAIGVQTHINSSASIAICDSGTATSSGAARSLLSSASTSINNVGIWAVQAPSAPAAQTIEPDGIASAETVGTPTVTVTGGPQTIAPDGIGSAETVGTPTVLNPTPAAAWVTATTDIYIGHRFGFASTEGEFTLEALADLHAWAPGAAANCDVWHSSDVDGLGNPTHWVLSHDNSTSRVLNGTVVNISATAWSTLSSYTTKVGGHLVREIADVAAAYPTKILWVENKRNVESTELLDYLDDLGVLPYTVAKGAMQISPAAFSADWVNNAAARGCPVWGFIYQADATSTNLATLLSQLSTVLAAGVPVMVALDYTANQAAWNEFVPWCQTNGIIPGAHILDSATAKSTALSKFSPAGGSGQFTMMASDAVDVIPTTPSAQTITPTGIASAEQVGTPTVTPGGVVVAPAGIASSEAVGTPTVTPGPVTIAPAGISSAETVGTPTVVPGGVVVAPTGIASAEAVGTPTVVRGPVTIAPAGISSAEQVGTPTVVRGPVTIAPAGIASAEAVGTPTVIAPPPGTQTIAPAGISSAEQVGTPTVVRGPVTIAPAGIASAEQVGTPTVVRGPVTIAPAGIVSAEAVGTPTVIAPPPGSRTIAPVGIASAEQVGIPTVTLGPIPGHIGQAVAELVLDRRRVILLPGPTAELVVDRRRAVLMEGP